MTQVCPRLVFALTHNADPSRDEGRRWQTGRFEVGIAGDVGAATGDALRFSNGLVADLSGDTGITAEPGFGGAWLRPGRMTEAFTTAAKMPVHRPLPGKAMAFDAGA